MSQDKALDLVSLLDFEAIDIGIFELPGGSHLTASSVLNDPERIADELQKKVADQGLTIA